MRIFEENPLNRAAQASSLPEVSQASPDVRRIPLAGPTRCRSEVAFAPGTHAVK